jgi:integrase
MPPRLRHAFATYFVDADAPLTAVQAALGHANVADLVTPPRPRRREMTTLSPQEARAFLEAAQGDRLEALYVLALTTGMRQGELLALRWRDVDLEAGTLQVRATLQRTRQGFVFGNRRRPAPGARSPSPLARWRPSGATACAKRRSACAWGRSGRTTTWCSPMRSAGR